MPLKGRIGNDFCRAGFLQDDLLSSAIGASRMVALRAARDRDSNGRMPAPALVPGSKINSTFSKELNSIGRD